MSLSCGCWRDERLAENSTTHGHTRNGDRSGGRSSEFIIWSGIIARCTNPKGAGYKKYGARGITICERWRNSFEAFLEDVGPRPSPDYQIDRVNNSGNYEPSNYRWATRSENLNNTSVNVRLEHDGKNLTVAEWSEVTGLGWSTIRERLKRGWSAAKTLETPVDGRCYKRAKT